MGFGLIATLLTIVAILAVLLPLARHKKAMLSPQTNDLEVYRDQLREVEADAARGMIDAQSAEQAKAEIGRRILLAQKAAGGDDTAAAGTAFTRWASMLAILSVPAVAVTVYLLYGSPEVPSMPLAQRMSDKANANSVADLVARAEAHLAQNPNDVRGWDVLAPIYLRLGRASDSVNAFRSAIRLGGENSNRLLGLGVALIGVSGGTITADAESYLNKAASLDANDIRPQIYLAQAQLQDGRPEAAIARLQGMLDRAPADVAWRAEIQQSIADIRQRQSGTAASTTNAPADAAPIAGANGPSQQEMEAAASMNEADRRAMIEGMVARLDEKLRDNGGTVDDWKRLLRAYMVIDNKQAAMDALQRARGALDEKARAELEQFAAGLGLAAQEAKP